MSASLSPHPYAKPRSTNRYEQGCVRLVPPYGQMPHFCGQQSDHPIHQETAMTDAADLLGMSNDQLAKVADVVEQARAWVAAVDLPGGGYDEQIVPLRKLRAAVRALEAALLRVRAEKAEAAREEAT